jgi:hypothetical protein
MHWNEKPIGWLTELITYKIQFSGAGGQNRWSGGWLCCNHQSPGALASRCRPAPSRLWRLQSALAHWLCSNRRNGRPPDTLCWALCTRLPDLHASSGRLHALPQRPPAIPAPANSDQPPGHRRCATPPPPLAFREFGRVETRGGRPNDSGSLGEAAGPANA